MKKRRYAWSRQRWRDAKPCAIFLLHILFRASFTINTYTYCDRWCSNKLSLAGTDEVRLSWWCHVNTGDDPRPHTAGQLNRSGILTGTTVSEIAIQHFHIDPTMTHRTLHLGVDGSLTTNSSIGLLVDDTLIWRTTNRTTYRRRLFKFSSLLLPPGSK